MKRLLLLLLVCGVARLAVGQVISARLGGTVLDPSGRVIPHAELKLVNVETGVVQTQAANSQGHYEFLNLPPGHYRLDVTASGFRELIETLRRSLRVGSKVRLNPRLQVGAKTEVVTVRGTPSLLQKNSAAIGFVVENKEIVDMPLNTRDFVQLATMMPGATIITAGSPNLQNSGLSISGGRYEGNNYNVDGVSDVEPNFVNVSVKPSIDSIQEFRESSSGYSAQYGRYSGGQIDLITKSGTNQFHGDLYEFLRNNAIEAKNFFSAPGPIPPFRRNDFGGTIGGPITIPKVYNGKDRTFFFFSYEGVRQQEASQNASHVPTIAERNGDFSQTLLNNGQPNIIYDPISAPTGANGYYLSDRLPFPGNIIPQNRIVPQMAGMLALLPPANLPGTGVNYVDSSPGTLVSNQYSGRIDQTFSSRLSLFGRYTFTNAPQIAPGYMPGRYTTNQVSAQNLSLNLNWILSPTVVNELRGGFDRNNNGSLNGSVQGASLVKQFWPPNVLSIGLPLMGADPGLPCFITAGGNGGMWYNNCAPGDPRGTSTYKSNIFEGIDNLTINHGKHILKFGVDVRHTQFRTVNFSTIRGSAGFQGLYTTQAGPTGILNYGGGNDIADMLLGLPTDDTRNFSDSPLYTRWNEFALYAQDTWHVTRRLTADLGLRWEYPAPISVVPVMTGYNFTSNAAGKLIPETVPNDANVVPLYEQHTYTYRGGQPGQNTIYSPDRHNFAPRVGLAYLLTPKTVVRSGFGVYFDEGPAYTVATEATNAPFAINEDVTTAYYTSPLAPSVCIAVCGELQSSIPNNPFANGFGFLPGASIINPFTNLFGMNPDFTLGYTMDYNFSVQRQLASGLVLQTAYVGSESRNLPIQFVGNIALPGVARPIPTAGNMWTYQWNGIANYNALQVQLEQRTHKGLYFVASYTWSKSIDTGSAANDISQNLIALENLNPQAVRGLSNFNVGQMFHFVTDYTPSLNQHFFFKGAPPLVKHIVAGWMLTSILDAETGSPQYPSFSGMSVAGVPCSLPASQRTVTHFFNTACVVNTLPNQLSDVPRDFVNGPGLFDLDSSIIRNFKITGSKTLQFRFEAFNALNNPNFLGLGTQLNTPTFGMITGAQPAREIEVALKFLF